MAELASDHYSIVIDEPAGATGWLRKMAVLVSNAAGVFEGFGTGPKNPGGRTVKLVKANTDDVVLEFTEQFGDDSHVSVSAIESDLGSQTLEQFEQKWVRS